MGKRCVLQGERSSVKWLHDRGASRAVGRLGVE